MVLRRSVVLSLLLLLAVTALAFAADSAKKEGATEAKDANDAKAGRRSLKDWSKLTDADYRALEDVWMEDEEEDPDDQQWKWTKTAEGKRQPPVPKGPKMEMGFATLTPGTKKDECEDIAKRWTQLLSTGAVPVKAYSIEDDKILLGVEGGYPDMFKVKDFVLEQKECIEFEWQQQKFYPKGKAKGGAKQSAEQKAADALAAKRREQEAEVRRKLESGELFEGKGKGPKAAAPAAAKNKGGASKPSAKSKGAEKAKVKAKGKAAAAAEAKKPTKGADTKAKAAAKPKPKEAASNKPRDEL